MELFGRGWNIQEFFHRILSTKSVVRYIVAKREARIIDLDA